MFRGLLAVCPHVPELLTVVALLQVRLDPMSLHLDNDVVEGDKLEDFLRLVAFWQYDQE
jgi:hypothetical protein